MPDARSSDYYSILRLPVDATPDEVRAAYKALALRWHPDHNLGSVEAEAKFKAATEAYAILSDPEKRNAYDLSRRVAATGIPLPPDAQAAAVFWQELGLAAMGKAGEILRDDARPLGVRAEGVARKVFDLSRTDDGRKQILSGIGLLGDVLKTLDGAG